MYGIFILWSLMFLYLSPIRELPGSALSHVARWTLQCCQLCGLPAELGYFEINCRESKNLLGGWPKIGLLWSRLSRAKQLIYCGLMLWSFGNTELCKCLALCLPARFRLMFQKISFHSKRSLSVNTSYEFGWWFGTVTIMFPNMIKLKETEHFSCGMCGQDIFNHNF